ncbi:uncharacterized protein LOC132737392 [Ruditapes philippinarum]|uniref:uncharacterized protein LOC132737392 n=1 Tax=Ruditapes philippinarum TaxID=129788 RepID=UPI00295C1713|nr:uncharacterized protein LOC132737392 [Ruditapes philippinarum]
MLLKVAKRIFKLLVASALVLEVILVTLVITWCALRQRPIKSRLCFNDAILKSAGLNSEIPQNLALAYGKDTTQNGHCFEPVKVLNAFVRQQMTFRYNTKINPEPIAFDLTTLNCTISSAKPGILILKDIKLVHVPGMSENEGMVAIQKTGYYFVTLHLTIMRENKTILANDDKIGKHQVIRIANKTDQRSILLGSTSSRCQMPAKRCEQSIFMAAAFNLEENDTVFVTVSHTFQMLSVNGMNYFSIIEI